MICLWVGCISIRPTSIHHAPLVIEAVTQRCGKCKRHLSPELFSPSHRGRNGHWCRDCRRSDWSARHHAQRDCQFCGKKYIPRQLKTEAAYCSRACKDAARNAKVRADLAAAKAGRTCAGVGCDVDISHRRMNAKWCSQACAQRQRAPELRRRYRLASKYGITPDRYSAMLAEQEGRCAICGASDPKTKHGFWHIDHCHASGKLRQLLCSTCNTGLGSFFDDPELLDRAAAYVRRHHN